MTFQVKPIFHCAFMARVGTDIEKKHFTHMKNHQITKVKVAPLEVTNTFQSLPDSRGLKLGKRNMRLKHLRIVNRYISN